MSALRDSRPLAPIFTLTVYGTPAPAGSKRAFPFKNKFGKLAVRVTDDSVRSKPWKTQIAQAAGEKMTGRDLLRGPLDAHFVFYVRRPKGHFNAKGQLRASAPYYPATRPDALKLARGVEDSLSGIVYADDSQIVNELLVKRYGEPERVEIWIKTIEPHIPGLD